MALATILTATLDQATFARELSLAVNSVEKKTSIPILGNVLLESNGERLSINSTDLECAFSTSMESKGTPGGRATIPAKKLLDYIRLLPAGEVALSIGENFWASLKAGRAKTRIAGMSADSFPELPKMPDTVTPIPAPGLARLIRRTQQGISNEMTRFTLNGALLKITEDEFIMVATDGHRLIYASIPGGGKPQLSLVPQKALHEAGKLAGELAISAEVQFATDDNHLFFGAGLRTLTARKLTWNFPDYERVLPKDFKGSATFNVAEFTSAVNLVRQAADERSRAIKLSIKDGAIGLNASTSDSMESTSSVAAEIDGDGVDIGINADYVLDALGAMESDLAVIRYKDSGSALQFEPAGTGADSLGMYKAIIMPMRV